MWDEKFLYIKVKISIFLGVEFSVILRVIKKLIFKGLKGVFNS